MNAQLLTVSAELLLTLQIIEAELAVSVKVY